MSDKTPMVPVPVWTVTPSDGMFKVPPDDLSEFTEKDYEGIEYGAIGADEPSARQSTVLKLIKGVVGLYEGGGPSIGGNTGAYDNAIIRADGPGGDAIQGSPISVLDSSSVNGRHVTIAVTDPGHPDSSLVLSPAGTGAFIVSPRLEGTGVGGSPRGPLAVDIQPSRAAFSQVASGTRCVAIGNSCSSQGVDSIAIGTTAAATNSSVAIGLNAQVWNSRAVVIGPDAVGGAGADYVVAIGDHAKANDISNVAIGQGATTTLTGSTAVGWNAIASAVRSTAIGTDASASASWTTALGYGAKATGLESVAIGPGALTPSSVGVALGSNAQATGGYDTALGYRTKTTANYAVAIGHNATSNRMGMVSFHPHSGGKRTGFMMLSISTTNTKTTSPLTLNGGAWFAPPWNYGPEYCPEIMLLPKSVLTASIEITAADSGGSRVAVFRRLVTIRMNAAGVTSLVGAVQTIGTDIKDPGAEIWDVNIVADAVNNVLSIIAIGGVMVPATTISWLARVDFAEITAVV